MSQLNRSLLCTGLLVAAVLLLAACGPGGSGASDSDLKRTTQEIARAFQADGDLEKARTALDGLSVANPRQWVVLTAEETIAANNDPENALALAALATALKLPSGVINEYAANNGLIAPTPTVAAPTATVAPAPTLTPVPTEPAAAEIALLPTATALAAGAPVTATDSLSAAAGDALPAATMAPAADNSPKVVATGLINVRSGPGVEYPVANALDTTQPAPITGKNAAGDWWQVTLADGSTGWVLAQLVTASGDLDAVALVADIPTPPPTPEPAPTAVAVAEAQPTAAAAATEAPAATPTTSPDAQPHFTLVNHRMWTKEENGACAGQHVLHIHVIDANGVRINGVRLQGIYTGEIFVTGAQGKGDGVIEYDLYGSGEGFRVIQNDDGRPATSDAAEGFTTKSLDIPVPTLIAGGYCADEADCQVFFNSYGCTGHHSWEATLQRNY